MHQKPELHLLMGKVKFRVTCEMPALTNIAGIIIYGASSSVGVFVTQLAKRIGLFTIGVTGNSEEYGKSFGLDVVINYKKTTDLVRTITHIASFISESCLPP